MQIYTYSSRTHSKNRSKNRSNTPEDEDDSENKTSILGATIETYLLERSRITSHQTGERAYHIYYLLLHGLSKAKRKSMGLSLGPSAFAYASPTGIEKCALFQSLFMNILYILGH